MILLRSSTLSRHNAYAPVSVGHNAPSHISKMVLPTIHVGSGKLAANDLGHYIGRVLGIL